MYIWKCLLGKTESIWVKEYPADNFRLEYVYAQVNLKKLSRLDRSIWFRELSK